MYYHAYTNLIGRRTARGSVTDYDPADDTDLGESQFPTTAHAT